MSIPPFKKVSEKLEPEINLFKRARSAEEFLSLIPPDAKPVFLRDGSVGFRDSSGKEYKVPTAISNEMRGIKSNVTDLPQRQYLTSGASGSTTQTVNDESGSVQSSLDSGSDFLTNVGGVGATTFDYDLSEPDLLEAIELRKSAYGVDTIETSSTINAQGEEQRSFIERVGDRLYEVFVTGPSQVITDVSPVSGKTVATSVPAVEGVASAATMFTGMPFGQLMNKMGEKFIERQQTEAERAAIGQPFYGAVQVQEKSTGRVIDLTTSPGLLNPLAKALNIEGGGAGTYAESDVRGPVIFNGREYPNIDAVIREVSQRNLVNPYVMAKNIPAGEDFDSSRVVGSGQDRIGIYDEDSGEIDLGFGRKGGVTGVALDSVGNLTYKTAGSGFVMGMGEMVNTGTGIAYGGSRANIAGQRDLTSSQAQNLLNRINAGEITSTPDTTEFLQNLGNPFSNVYGDDFDPTTVPVDPIFGTAPVANVFGKEYLPSFEDQVTDDADADTYQTPTTSPLSERTQEEYFSSMPTGGFFTDDDNESGVDSVDDATEDAAEGFDFKKGGQVPKQEGGIANQQGVSQIVQGAGFIAPQGNATDQQTIADDIPMEAEEGDFIINAPAAEFAGRQDIVDMILEAINSLKEKGVDIQYGNPKIPVKSSVQLAVSRNEVYIPKILAEEIGYDKLEKINNRGKREVERRQQESQKQANRGGFVRKAKGDVVEDRSNIMGADDSNFLQDLGRFVVDELGDKIKGFLSPREKQDTPPLPVQKPKDLIPKEQEKEQLKGVEKRPAEVKKYTNFRNLISERKGNLNLAKDRGEAYDLLNLLEVSEKVDPRKGNVPTDTSGFTVGIGFDLGKHNEQDLRNFNFSDSLFNKLLPYSGRIGKEVEQDPNFMLTDDELDEVNKIVLNTKYNEFEKRFPNYKKVNPLDKAVLYSAYYLGALTRERNPYTTFMSIYDKTNSITNALKRGIINKINNPKNYEQERAEKALKWLGSKQPPPKLKPKSIQDKPDAGSFLAPPMRV